MIVDIVLVGRNEGRRLRDRLAAAQGCGRRLIYVDSGSGDDSADIARQSGAEVIVLDESRPHSAARGRNAGFAATQQGPEPAQAVQFVDADCRLQPGWIEAAQQRLAADPGLGLVTGWRSELHPEASLYNRICDHEWHRPPGPIETCGGDIMVRAQAFDDAGGYDPAMIAGEDEAFCLKVRRAGWQCERLPLTMTAHDADMHSFGQWWQRAVRAGHAYAHMGHAFPGYYARERWRIAVFAFFLPLLAALGLVMAPWLFWLVFAAYVLSGYRGYRALRHDGVPRIDALPQAALLSLSKFPNAVGLAKFHYRRHNRSDFRLIEYK